MSILTNYSIIDHIRKVVTRTFYNVGGKLVTERELNAAKKVLPDIQATEETYSLEMSMEEFMEKAKKVED